MLVVNISEAKANLSRLVDMVCHGEEVVIAKNNLPLVDLVAHRKAPRRKLGLHAGKVEMPDDFTAESLEINKMFYGGD